MNFKASEDRVEANVDLSSLQRKLWLVKVPKYLSQRLSKANAMDQIGTIRISDDNSQILFILSQEMANNGESDGDDRENVTNLPIEHKFFISDVDSQTMTLFSHQSDGTSLAVEGSIEHKGELSPVVTNNYLDLHKQRVKQMAKPQRTLKQLDRTVTVFRPITNVPKSKASVKKPSPVKKCKKDRETVRNMLFELFEKHQYYNMRSLERLTRQPVYYLKEVMSEMCVYNTKNPHQYMWELRPEFRHYMSTKKDKNDHKE